MKILIDIDELEQNGTLSPQLAAILRTHAIRDTGSTAINVLLAFGAIAIAAGLLSLIPSASFAALLGAVFTLFGWLIKKLYSPQWGKLASIWMMIGALVLSGAIGILTNQPFVASLLAVIILTGVSIIAESRLLIALVPLALIAALGGSAGYWEACYAVSIQEPTLTIVLFSILAYGAWELAKHQKGLLQSLAITFARMCIILVNFGFWIGSLWGDTPGSTWHASNTTSYLSYSNQQIPDIIFIIGWAVALVLAGAWGAKQGRRFIVNTVAVFGAIHFYTQWFEHIGFYPISVIIAGVATILFGLGLWRYNCKKLSA